MFPKVRSPNWAVADFHAATTSGFDLLSLGDELGGGVGHVIL